MGTESQRGWGATAIGVWCDDHWEEALLISLPNFAAFSMAFTSDELAGIVAPSGYENWFRCSALILAIVFFVAQVLVLPPHFRKQRKVSRLDADLTQCQDEKASLADRIKESEVAICDVRGGVFEDYKKIVRNALRDMSDELEFCHTDRVTLYYHCGADGIFVPVEREAGDPRFRSIRRKSYPDSEGCISEAWKKGHHFEVVKVDDDWIDWCATRGMKKKDAACIRMQSRLYFAWRVKNREKTDDLAVLVLESTNPSRWDGQELLVSFERRQGRTLNDVLAQIKPQLPDSRLAAKKGM